MFQPSFPARLTAIVLLILSIGDPQGKPNIQEKGLTQDDLSKIRSVVPAVGMILAKIGGISELSVRGSAVVVRSDGIVVTNHHVVYDKEADIIYEDLYLRLQQENTKTAFPAQYHLEVVLLDPQRDLALLRVKDTAISKPAEAQLKLPVIELGDEKDLDLLEDLVVIGFPEKGGTSPTLSRGVVQGIDLKAGWVKTDAKLMHGHSGGATVNRQGKLIGIATKVESDITESNVVLGTIGYSRSINLVRQMLEILREIEPSKKEENSSPRPIVAVTPKSPATSSAPQKMIVHGMVKDARTGNPIAGARVGLLIFGRPLEENSIITWGGTNADGKFELQKPVAEGKYGLRVKVIGDFAYAPYSGEVEIKPDMPPLIIGLKLVHEKQ